MIGRTINYKIIKNFSFTLVGSLVFSGSQWLINVLLIKFYSIRDLDEYNFLLSIIVPFNLLMSLNMRNVLAADQGNTIDCNKYYKFRLISMVISGFACIVIIYVSNSLSILAMSILLLRFFDNFFEFYYGMYQKNNDMYSIARSQILRSLFLIILLLGSAVVTKNVIFSFLLAAASSIVLNFLEQKRLKLDIAYNWSSFKQKEFYSWLKIYIPLGFVALVDNLCLSIPKYLLKYYGFENAVGIFSSLVILIFIEGFVVSALCNTLLPKLAREFEFNINSFRSTVRKSVIMIFSLSIAAFLVVVIGGKVLLQIFYNEEIAAYHFELAILFLAALVWNVSTLYSFCLYALKEYKAQTRIQLVFLIVILGSSFLLVPKYGIAGAIYSFGVAHLSRLALNYFFYVKKINKV